MQNNEISRNVHPVKITRFAQQQWSVTFLNGPVMRGTAFEIMDLAVRYFGADRDDVRIAVADITKEVRRNHVA